MCLPDLLGGEDYNISSNLSGLAGKRKLSAGMPQHRRAVCAGAHGTNETRTKDTRAQDSPGRWL